MIVSESGNHQFAHRQGDERLATGVRALKIARESAIMRNPGVRSFNHPSPGQHMKTFGHDLVPIDHRSFLCPYPTQAGPGVFDDFEADPIQVCFDPVLKRTFLPALRPDQLEARQVSCQRSE